MAYQVDGVWVHSVRLTQAPVAITTDGRAGAAAGAEHHADPGGRAAMAGFVWNEVQDLYLPPDFRGDVYPALGAVCADERS